LQAQGHPPPRVITADGNPSYPKVIASVAEFEREMIRERTLVGLRVARANGKQVGRPKRVFRRDELVRLREEGHSWRTVASKLGIPVMTAVDAYRDYCTETVAANGAGQRRKLRGKSSCG
jgi:DNA invertase Pin-like site-specific DNA recombinase